MNYEQKSLSALIFSKCCMVWILFTPLLANEYHFVAKNVLQQQLPKLNYA